LRINGSGKAPNKKKAGEYAALQILETLYTNFPTIFKSVRAGKENKCVKT
jgi:hypothetical protein